MQLKKQRWLTLDSSFDHRGATPKYKIFRRKFISF